MSGFFSTEEDGISVSICSPGFDRSSVVRAMEKLQRKKLCSSRQRQRVNLFKKR